MKRLIFSVIISFLPLYVYGAGTCVNFKHGVYATAHLAGEACAATKGDICNSSMYPDGIGFVGFMESSNFPGVHFHEATICDAIVPQDGTHVTLHQYLIFNNCPEGSIPDPETGICVCEQGALNLSSLYCEDPRCNSPTTYNESTELCEKECPVDKPWSDSARDCVAPPERDGCDNKAFNPINFFNGHKLQTEVIFETIGDFPLTFSWLYNSFGNHRKTGAGYSLGLDVAGETMLHTEPPLEEGELRLTLPLDKNPKMNYTGGAGDRWRHNHSYFLGHYVMPDGAEKLIAFRPDGVDIHFNVEDGLFSAVANYAWQARKDLNENQEHVGWIIQNDGRIEQYDLKGRILRVENERGQGVTYTYYAWSNYGPQQETIVDDNGNKVTMYYNDDGKLKTLSRNDGSVYYFSYDSNGMLKEITFPRQGAVYPKRQFRYEDPRFPHALTSVIDEAGKAYSAFAYDDQGRAISSEHAGGADSGTVEYVNSNTRRLTNALGKSTTYTFSDVGDGKRITSVDGEASANCAAANKGYTYDDNGFIASETDWEGNVTTYTRDNLGRELTRTEAAGTPEARTITTEWHPEFNVPARVTTPETVTDYSYDSSGRLLGQKVTPVTSP